MLVLVKANVLTVGLEGRIEALKGLPIRVFNTPTGLEAGRSLKNENIDSIISNWNLPDAPNGRFVKTLRSAKPYLPVIVVVRAADPAQEIAARSIGAVAVLGSDESDEVFRRTIAQALGLDDAVKSEKIYAIANDAK
jgi:DNA-binding NarL/FixJ family response regulator